MSKPARKALRTRMPAHLKARPGVLFKLRRWANYQAAFYGAPVYLVGSALRDKNSDPRDWDIRIRLTDKDFGSRYGYPYTAEEDAKRWFDEGITGQWTRVRLRWAKDCMKGVRRGWRWTNLNIDFQIYPDIYWKQFKGKPRWRLDTLGRHHGDKD